MIPLSVSEISGCDAFCDVQQDEDVQDLGILVVGCYKKSRARLLYSILTLSFAPFFL